MNKYVLLLYVIFFISFSGIAQNALPDGTYFVKNDEFADEEPSDNKMLIQNTTVILTVLGKAETFELEWIDKDSFVVKGFTESVTPSAFEKEQLADYRPSYNVTKVENGEYFFNLGDQNSSRHIQTGKFVKIE